MTLCPVVKQNLMKTRQRRASSGLPAGFDRAAEGVIDGNEEEHDPIWMPEVQPIGVADDAHRAEDADDEEGDRETGRTAAFDGVE